MSDRTDLKFFIASSGELNQERDESLKVIIEVNKHYPQLHLEPMLFELDTASGNTPGIDRIQDGINPLLDRSDVVIILFYSKIGEFTKEEFERAINTGKKILFYLKEGFQPITAKDSIEYTKLLQLKEEIEIESKIRYQKFKTLKDYHGLLYIDLNKYIDEKASLEKVVSNSEIKVSVELKDNILDATNQSINIEDLNKLPHPNYFQTPYHKSVRLDEQQKFITEINNHRFIWLVTDWNLNEGGFVGSVIEQLNLNNSNANFIINCDDIKDIEKLIDSFKSQFQLSIQKFCNLILII